MAKTMDDILHPGLNDTPPGYPHAPPGWSPTDGEQAIADYGLVLGADHWKVVCALQEYFARHENQVNNLRELHDALEEKFHRQGGRRYLFQLFPKGPVVQGCRLAGLEVPAGRNDPASGATF